MLKVNRPRRNPRRAALVVVAASLAGFAFVGVAADRFDDVSVEPEVFFQGETQHGYIEHRINVENHSPNRTHTITLELPNESHAAGTSLRRISRTAAIGPNSTVAVSLWQPALPLYGDDRVAVYVDGRRRGEVHLGASTRHRTRYLGPGGVNAGTFLLSRAVNSDDLDKLLKGEATSVSSTAATSGPFSPAMAVGPPNAPRGSGNHPNAWSPDYGRSGGDWLEVDFSPDRPVKKLRLYTRDNSPNLSAVLFLDTSSKEFARLTPTNLPVPVRVTSVSHPFWEFDVTSVATNGVSRVRLEFITGLSPASIGVDAVELHDGTSGSFASGARASSSLNGTRYRGTRSPAEITPTLARAELEPSAWRDHWLAYTPFEAVVLLRSDYAAMPPAAQSALWNYVQAGGNLVVLGPLAPPAPWDRKKINATDGSALYHVGFGSLVSFAQMQAKDLNPVQIRTLRDLGRTSANPWNGTDERTANSSFPVVENLRIPVRGLVGLMLVFVLVVGPANLFILARLNRRIWMLWTIPAISAITSLLVFAWSLLSEGVTPTTRIEGVTLLDQTSHRATTLGMAAIYAPLTPSDGLRYSYDTEVTMLGTAGLHSYGPNNSGTPVELELSQVQHLRRGWVAARVPVHFQLRKSQARRERVQFERNGKNLLAVNGLGANIESLWFADANGAIFTATNIIAGQKAALASSNAPRVDGKLSALHNEIFRSAMWDATRTPFKTDPVPFMRPGTYIAELKEQPFLENALGKRAMPRTRAIVYGVLGPEDVK